jgi:hypothetical protein
LRNLARHDGALTQIDEVLEPSGYILIRQVRAPFACGVLMTARQLIDGASFGPDVLKAISQALDEAWQVIARNFGNDPQDIETARTKLASAVLSIADEGTCNVEVLKRAALQRMALDYRRRDKFDFTGVRRPEAVLPQQGETTNTPRGERD